MSNSSLASITGVTKATITNGYRYTVSLLGKTGDGNVTLSINGNAVKDNNTNGNAAVTCGTIIVDNTRPTVSYNLAGGIYNTTKTVRVTPNDANYRLMGVYVSKNGVLDWDKGTHSTTGSYYDVTLDSEGTWIIYSEVIDWAGNYQDQEPKNGEGCYYQTYVIDTTAPTISNVFTGGMIHKDPTFASGLNETNIYNNTGNGNVTHERVAMTTPNGSYALKIKATGAASPGYGGFYFADRSSANNKYITKIIAKIPVGYTINWASNDFGTGGTSGWLSSQAGTGDWAEYVVSVQSGSSGTFSTTNFYYLSGGTTPTASAPLEWYVAYATVFKQTEWSQSAGVSIEITDTGSGVAGYGINQSLTNQPAFTSVTPATKIGHVFNDITSNGTYYLWVKDVAGNTTNQAIVVNKVDRVAPTLTLSSSVSGTTATITITSDVANLYNDTAPGVYSIDVNSVYTEISGTVADASSSYPGPALGKTWYMTKTGESYQWQGIHGRFNGNAGDKIAVSGYYYTNAPAGITNIISSTLWLSDWSAPHNTTLITQSENLVPWGWKYFHVIFRVNESFSNALLESSPMWTYSWETGSMYWNGINWRVIPASNTTAEDIHIRKYASGNQSLAYFQSGNGTLMSGNTFSTSTNGIYTVYVEDLAGNGTIQTINVGGIDSTPPSVPTSNIRQTNSSGTILTNGNWYNHQIWWGDWYSTDASGIARYELSSGCNGAVSEVASPTGYTYTSDTNWYLCVRAVDNAGNTSAWSSPYYIRVDMTAPTLTFSSPLGSYTTSWEGAYDMGWFNSAQYPTVTLSDTGGSGLNIVQLYLHSVNTGTYVEGGVTDLGNNVYQFNMPNDDLYIPHIIIKDNAGNSGPATRVNGQFITLWHIDKTPPYVNAISYDPGWKNTSIYKEVDFDDALSGIQRIEYSYDQGTWYSDWDGSISNHRVYKTWGGDQDRVLWFRAIDNAGNIYMFPSSYDLKIDTTPPSLGNYTWSDYTTQQSQNICLNSNEFGLYVGGVTDNLSGVEGAYVWASNDGATSWNILSGTKMNGSGSNWYYSVPMTTDGTYNIRVHTIDNASNWNWGGRTAFTDILATRDTTLPTVSYSTINSTTVRVTPSDTNYSYMMVHVYKGGVQDMNKSTNWTNASYYDVTFDSDGSWTVYTQAFDCAGNKQNQSPDNGWGWYYQTYTVSSGKIQNASCQTCASCYYCSSGHYWDLGHACFTGATGVGNEHDCSDDGDWWIDGRCYNVRNNATYTTNNCSRCGCAD